MICPNGTNGIYYFDYRNLSNTAGQGDADRRTYCLTKVRCLNPNPRKTKLLKQARSIQEPNTTYAPQMQA